MSAKAVFSDLLVSGALKNDPCHFRLTVTGEESMVVHDFLINAAAGCTWRGAKELGRKLQELLQGLKWGDDPKAVFDRDVIFALVSMAGVIGPDSSMVVRDRARGVGATFTSIKVSGERDCQRLMKELKDVSKRLQRRKC